MARRALLLTNDFPPTSGGIAGYLFGLWSHLDRTRTAVLAPRVPGAREFDRTHDLRVYRRRLLWPLGFPVDKLARIAASLALAPRVLRAERTQILHAGHVLTAGVAALVLKRRLGLPYAVYGYGADLTDYAQYPGVARLRRRILREAEGVVTISDFSVDTLRRDGVDEGRIAKVLMGIDIARFRPDVDGDAIRRRHGLGDRPVLLTVARLVGRKGHDVVIRALRQIRDKRGETVYVIVGAGPERARLERLAEEIGVARSVVFAGFVAAEDLPAYYAACDVFVLCSRQVGTDFEGGGNVSLEASASGRPVVVGRSGGTGEHVLHGETGLLVDPEDPAEVAAAVVALLDDRAQAERLGRRGRQLVEDCFVWDKTVTPMERLL
jgi:phosphatidylinositol alpha-1,6-mannosyltransferase